MAAAAEQAYLAACAARSVLMPLPPVLDALRALAAPPRRGAPAEPPLLVLDISGNSVAVRRVLSRRLNEDDILAVLDLLAAPAGAALATSVAELRCRCNDAAEAAAAALAALVAAERLPRLAALDLAENELNGAGSVALLDALRLHAPQLRLLVLDGNGIGDEGGAAVARLVAEHAGLRHLSVARCELHTDSVIALASALAHTRSLAHLDLSEPRLFSRNEETALHIARALRSNATLEHLALRKHPYMSDVGVAALLDYALDNAAAGGLLSSLDLSSNRLGPPTGVAFARAFESGLALRNLNLSRCRVADEGAVALAESLQSLGGAARLERLDLRCCGIGDEGEEALAAWMGSESCSLREIQLFGNDNKPGARGTTALGITIMSGAARCATDLKPFVVDDKMEIARQETE